MDNIIKVNITTNDESVEAENFNLPILIGDESEFSSGFTVARTKTFNSMQDIAQEGFAVDSKMYKSAQAIFAQKTIRSILVGKKLANETYTEALIAITDENNDFYGILTTSRDATDIHQIAQFAESNDKIASFATSDSNVLDATSALDIGSTLMIENYKNSFITYHTDADNVYIDSAVMANLLYYEPGSYSLSYKTLSGIAYDTIKRSDIAVLDSKKCNYYTQIQKVSMYQQGLLSSGKPIATSRNLFYFKRQLQSALLNDIRKKQVIKFNASGLIRIRSTIEEQVRQAVGKEIMAYSTKQEIADKFGKNIDDIKDYNDEFGYSLTIPKASDKLSFDIATNTLKDITIRAKIAEEIQRIDINVFL